MSEQVTGTSAPQDATRSLEPSESPAPLPVDAPDRAIGRYEIKERLGVGGMGVVYAAWDPELDRRVALKVVSPGIVHRDDGAARLAREARAMASLSHPNVVPVYDVGVHAGQVYLAMELIEGETLTRWLEARRPWTQVVDVFVRAGRGLAAAHAVGLVHRDFKPSNVMVGEDGRVRVLDFGLARSGVELSVHSESDEDGAGSDSISSPIDPARTAAGHVMGTPKYMSPEQHSGGDVDARSDQYAFCVALFRALHGVLPYTGATLEALHRAKRQESLPVTERVVPVAIRSALERGLRAASEARWPDMDALLDALQRPIRRRSQRHVIVAVAVAVAVVGVGAVGFGGDGGEDPCASSAERLVGVWDDAARDRVRQAFLATGVGHAPDTADRVSDRLDAYATSWIDARVEVCRADRSETLERDRADATMSCLDHQVGELRASVAALTTADKALVGRAVRMVSELPRSEDCQWLEMDAVALPPDAQTRAEIGRIREGLAGAVNGALLDATGVPAKTADLVERSRATGWAPLLAEAQLVDGLVRKRAGAPGRGLEQTEAAYWTAVEAGDDATAAKAANSLVFSLAFDAGRNEEAEVWIDHAKAAVDRLRGDTRIKVSLGTSLGTYHMQRGDYAEARKQFEEVLRRVDAEFSDDTVLLCDSHSNLGVVLARTGETGAAIESLERAVALCETALGPWHPETAMPLSSLGMVERMALRFDRAQEHLTRAVEILERAPESDPMKLGMALGNLANIETMRGNPRGALALQQRSLAALEDAVGPAHPALAMALSNLAGTMSQLHEIDGAREHARRALEMNRELLGPDHIDVARSLTVLGDLVGSSGDLERALRHYEEALAVLERGVGLEHPAAAITLVGLGAALVRKGDEAGARETFGRAVRQCETLGGDPLACNASRWWLAQLLPSDEEVDALRLAKEALEAYRAMGGHEDREAEIERWLDHR